MQINKIGEFALIQRFRKLIRTDASVIMGSGDDCAVLKFSEDKHLLFTCDMIVQGVDFTLKDEPELIGRKAIAVSLSDIAACAGIPRYALISLAMPPDTQIEFVDRLFKGMLEIAKKFKLNIVGGDLSRQNKLAIDVSMLGLIEKKRLVLRKGAKKGDIIFTSGALGASLAGKHLKFIPRIKEARYLSGNFKVNAMIDISDGLASDLNHILEQSSAGAVIYEELIPLAKKARGLSDALYAGEDFELLFCLSAQEAKRLIAARKGFWPIGEIVEKKYGFSLIDRNNREKRIIPKGFCHF